MSTRTIRITWEDTLVRSATVPDHKSDTTYTKLERMVNAGQWGEPIGTTLDMHDSQGTIIYSRTW